MYIYIYIYIYIYYVYYIYNIPINIQVICTYDVHTHINTGYRMYIKCIYTP